MHLNTEKKCIIIDDKIIYDFMSTKGNEEFLNVCEALIRNICFACNHKSDNDNNLNVIMSHLNMFKGELSNVIVEKINANTPQKQDDAENFMNLRESLDKTKLELIVELKNTKQHNDIPIILDVIKELKEKFNEQDIKKQTIKQKGEVGEAGLKAALEAVLPSREGYTIISTAGTPHSCDLNIEKVGFPDIRVESKAYTGPVPSTETKKFLYDLNSLRSHGIFVSLHSSICGKKQIEVDLLPNKTIAIYLSNNQYDGYMIKEYVNLIYSLHSIITEPDFNNNIILSPQILESLNLHIIDLHNNITALRSNMNQGIIMLSKISTSSIEKILKGLCNNVPNTQNMFITSNNDQGLKSLAPIFDKAEEAANGKMKKMNGKSGKINIIDGTQGEEDEITDQFDQSLRCDKCDKQCASKRGLTNHKNKCTTSKTTDPISPGARSVEQVIEDNKLV